MKKTKLLLFAAVLPLAMAGCGNSDSPADADIDSSVEDTLLELSADSSLGEDDYGDVTLCDYKNLSAERTVYEITEDSIDEEIEYMLSDYAEYLDVDRPSQADDYVSVLMTGKDGDTVIFDYTDEPYDIYLGYEEFGSEFDDYLTGVSAGDTLNFQIQYDAEYEDDELAGMTIDYEVTVENIYVESVPELTDEFLAELGYESPEDMKAQLEAELKEWNDEKSNDELRENLLSQVIDNSTFNSYSQSLYDACAQSVDESYMSYGEMFDCETVEEVYEIFEMTADDVRLEILNQVCRMIVVQKISEAEGIVVSDADYEAGIARYVYNMDYDSIDELLADYDEDTLRSWILEDKVMDFLVEHAAITDVPYDGSDDIDDIDFEEEIE